MSQITICVTYFKSLTLANLSAALHALRQQDLSRVAQIVVVDNNTEDPSTRIKGVIDAQDFPVPVQLDSHKHRDASLTHSWSTNMAVRASQTPWLLFTRADYLLHPTLLTKFLFEVESRHETWDGFVTSHGYHLNDDVQVCERAGWRRGIERLSCLTGTPIEYSVIDSGVWLARRESFERVGGLDESLTAWGHAQTLFQYALHESGTEFVCIPETLFYHPQHDGYRDIDTAHKQLRERGIDIKQLWSRYGGEQPYR